MNKYVPWCTSAGDGSMLVESNLELHATQVWIDPVA
jgi:hypothetical protein